MKRLWFLVLVLLCAGCVADPNCHGCPPHTDPVHAVIGR